MMKQSPSCRIEQASNGGHTVTMQQPPGPKGEYREPATKVYGKGEHEKMFSDVRKHLGVGAGARPNPVRRPAKVGAGPSQGGAIASQMSGDNF